MNWVMGFREVGWEVFLVEAVSPKEMTFSSPESGMSDQEIFWKSTAAEFGFENHQCLLVDGQSPDRSALLDFARTADLFLNYSGQFALLDLLPSRLPKGYLDVDPVFTQIWAAEYGCKMNFSGHDAFFSVGLQLENGGARVPDLGIPWKTTSPPLPSAFWRERALFADREVPEDAPWSTVAHWYGYRTVEFKGVSHGGKRDSLLQMVDLPRDLPDLRFSIASDLKPEWGDWEEFTQAGWRLLSASEVCRDVPAYLAFLSGSRGEIGIAKEGYIVSNSGWVSDRSLVYLALGKPVLLQNTGWAEVLPPLNGGLLGFDGVEDCTETLRKVEKEYAFHAKEAQIVADQVFRPERIISTMLQKAGWGQMV